MKTTTDYDLSYILATYESGDTETVWQDTDGERALQDIVADVREKVSDHWNIEDLKTVYFDGPLLEGWDNSDNPNAAWEHQMEDIRVDPEEPENCSGNWISPLSLFGGLAENPGVHGHGGGVIVQEVCPQTGWYKTTDTADQNCTGHGNPVESIEYAEPDHESLEWVYRVLAAEIAEAIDGIAVDIDGESYSIIAIAEQGSVTFSQVTMIVSGIGKCRSILQTMILTNLALGRRHAWKHFKNCLVPTG